MTPTDASSIRKRLSLPDGRTPTQTELAAAFRVGRLAIARWETGAAQIPGPAAVLYRLLDRQPALFATLIGDAA